MAVRFFWLRRRHCAAAQQKGKVFALLACASCLGHPKHVEQVGGEQEPHSALFKKIVAERKHPADRIYTHKPAAGSPGSEQAASPLSQSTLQL